MSLKIKSVTQMMDIIGNEILSGTIANTGSYVGLDNNKQLVLTQKTAIVGRQELDTTNTPVALYNFDGNLDDSSATGEDLSVHTGAELYYPNLLFSGSQSFYADLNTELTTAANVAHQITGDVTVMSVVNLSQAATTGYIVTHAATTETAAKNCLYSLAIKSDEPYFLSESGGGVDADYTLTHYDFPYNQWVFFAVTRTSNVIQFYLNGAPWGPASSALTAPTGGGSGYLWIGGWNTYRVQGQIKTVKIIGSALTPAQMMAEYERVTGDFKFL